MTWLNLRLRVVTPVFNQGSEHDSAFATVRPSSFRGSMHFWLRALAGTVVTSDLAALARIEQCVFGNTIKQSPFAIRLPNPPKSTPPPSNGSGSKVQPVSGEIAYLLGQGLAAYDKVRKGRYITRPHVPAGTEFDVKLRLPEDTRGTLALAAFWLTCAYGGVGARTRRGFGNIRIEGGHGPLPPQWSHDQLVSPGAEHYEHLERLWPADLIERCRPALLTNAGFDYADEIDSWDRRPDYPVLSRVYTRAALAAKPSAHQDGECPWEDILRHAGEQFRHFRANEEHPNASYTPKIESWEWKEVVSPGSNSDHFQVGALGLPVGYRDGRFVKVRSNSEEVRRASPLWLRVVPGRTSAGKDTLRLFSFAFLSQFLPQRSGQNGYAIGVEKQGRPYKNVHVYDTDVDDVTEQWMSAVASGESFATNDAHRKRPHS